jgi:hypothetical protein
MSIAYFGFKNTGWDLIQRKENSWVGIKDH